jgi:arginyl-tRNA--protein-N-Asp/Glu arginylyltransferase
MRALPLVLTQEHPCSYLEQQAQSLFVQPDFILTRRIYAQLLEQGFRRSGSYVYRPKCPSCSACIPVRLPVDEFKPNRSQKRVLAKNADTRVQLKAPVFNRRHYELYRSYQKLRHSGGDMEDMNPGRYLQFLRSDWCKTIFAEFVINGELAAVAAIDRLANALSAVYTFFDPRFSAFSPGVYAVLWQIGYARELGLRWVYLGYWIEECRKMTYKTQYRPLQALIGGQWRQFEKHQPIVYADKSRQAIAPQ